VCNALFEKGREGFLDGTIDWDGATNMSAAILDLGTTDVGIKAVTAATVATPIVVTATAHGFTNGDIVYIDATDGTSSIGNNAAKGLWKIANQAANTFELQTLAGVNSTGFGAFSGTAVAVNLGPSASGDNWDDFDGAVVGAGSGKVNLASRTVTQGVADAADSTFTSITGNSIEAVVILQDTGTATTSRMIALITGKFLGVVAADVASSATTIWVDKPLPATVASQTVVFSNGLSVATVAGTAGNRNLTCTATTSTIAAGHQGMLVLSGSGLPVVPNGGNIVVAYDNGANKIFKL